MDTARQVEQLLHAFPPTVTPSLRLGGAFHCPPVRTAAGPVACSAASGFDSFCARSRCRRAMSSQRKVDRYVGEEIERAPGSAGALAVERLLKLRDRRACARATCESWPRANR